MKLIGKLLSIFGTIAVIAYPPYKVLGDTHWGFIFGNVMDLEMFGKGVPVYEHLDITVLLIEVAAVNSIAIALMLMGKK